MGLFGANIPRTELLESQLLPAAGAFITPEWFPIPKGTTRITYWITFTRGSATSQPVFEHHYSNGTEDAREIIQDDSSLTITAPNGVVDLALERLKGPVPADGNAITYALTYERLPAATTRVRLLAAEVGDTANPGTIQIFVTADVEPNSEQAGAR